MHDIYCTSFCNHGHRLSTGKPVGHECYTLHPDDLLTEAYGNAQQVSALCARGMRKRIGDGPWFRGNSTC